MTCCPIRMQPKVFMRNMNQRRFLEGEIEFFIYQVLLTLFDIYSEVIQKSKKIFRIENDSFVHYCLAKINRNSLNYFLFINYITFVKNYHLNSDQLVITNITFSFAWISICNVVNFGESTVFL